jgi:hypothetical protein
MRTHEVSSPAGARHLPASARLRLWQIEKSSILSGRISPLATLELPRKESRLRCFQEATPKHSQERA